MRACLVATMLATPMAACGGNDARSTSSPSTTHPPSVAVIAKYRIDYQLEGTLEGPRAIGEAGEGRIGCTMDLQSIDRFGKPHYLFMLSAVENWGEEHGSGVYFEVFEFRGVGTYPIGATPDAFAGHAWVFDSSNLQNCGRPYDQSCFKTSSGCTLRIDEWSLDPAFTDVPPGMPDGVVWGTAKGEVRCDALLNAAGAPVALQEGRFTCRAADWSKAGM